MVYTLRKSNICYVKEGMAQILPHGGTLINRLLVGKEREDAIKRAASLKKITVDFRHVTDIEMIGIGAFSPLTGFMSKRDYLSVLDNNRLSDGTVWTIPVTLAVSKDEASNIKEGEEAAIYEESGHLIAIIKVSEKYDYDKKKEEKSIYLTESHEHPGVVYTESKGEVYIAGDISVIDKPAHEDFLDHRLDPVDTRRVFSENGWNTVVGFQTRNPVHRAHEYIIKCALEIVDGLFLNPLVGDTKKEDIPADIRMECYKVILDKYFPKDRVVLGVLGASMRYAGPKEAIFHAIIRKNYGCTHFIVGRDHAGVGKFYGTFDAQKIFDLFTPEEIGIIPLKFEHSFYCRKCGGLITAKTCPHSKENHLFLSGTKVREMLSSGEIPPEEFTRPEVAKVLIDAYVDKSLYTKPERVIKIRKDIYEEIVSHSKGNAPNESCGILAGKDRTVTKLYKMTNTESSPVSFLMDPKEQLSVMKDMRASSLDMLGIYHSHPSTNAHPSAKDLDMAFYDDASYVIVSLQDKNKPVIQSFAVKGGKVEEEEVKII